MSKDKDKSLINARDKYGSSALHFAAVSNQELALNSLIKAGSDALAVNNAGFKASQVASNGDLKSILVQEEEKQVALDRQAKLAAKPAIGGTKQGKKLRSVENVNGSSQSLKGSKDGVSAANANAAKKSKLRGEVTAGGSSTAISYGSISGGLPSNSAISNSKSNLSAGKKSPSRSASPSKEVKVKTFTGNF